MQAQNYAQIFLDIKNSEKIKLDIVFSESHKISRKYMDFDTTPEPSPIN